ATGRMQLDSYQRLHDPLIRELMTRVRCEHSEQVEAQYPSNMSGTLRVHARGETFADTVIVPTGEPSNMLRETALLAKFTHLVEPTLGPRQTAELAAVILRVDEQDGAASLFFRSESRN